MDECGIWSKDHFDVLQVFTKEFTRKFKKDSQLMVHQTIPLSRDITVSDNEWLTTDATEREVQQVVKQINPLKASGPDVMHAIFL